MIRAIGIVLIGLAATSRGFLTTNKGESWLNRVIDWATERYCPQEAQKSVIEALRTFDRARRDGILTEKDDSFDEALRIIKDADPDQFENLDPEDEVVKLERVCISDHGRKMLKQGGIVFDSFHIDAVMEDGSRKTVSSLQPVHKEKTRRHKKRFREKKQFRNRLEERIKWGIIGIGAIGFGLSVFSLL